MDAAMQEREAEQVAVASAQRRQLARLRDAISKLKVPRPCELNCRPLEGHVLAHVLEHLFIAVHSARGGCWAVSPSL